MTIRFRLRWLLVPILFLSLQWSRAQTPSPSGFSEFYFNTNSLASFGMVPTIVDISGMYNLNLPVIQKDGNQVNLSLSMAVVQNASGQLKEDTNNNVTGVTIDSNDPFAGQYHITGQVKTVAGNSVETFVITFFHSNLNDGSGYSLRISSVATNDPVAGMMTGVSVVDGKFHGNSLHGKTIIPWTTSLPAGMDGSWSLSMTNFPTRPLTGSGRITLSSGRAFPVNVNGNFNSREGTWMLKVNGVGAGRGISLNTSLPTDEGTIFVWGKALGQTVGTSINSYIQGIP